VEDLIQRIQQVHGGWITDLDVVLGEPAGSDTGVTEPVSATASSVC
jgi:hypothetical protein